MLWRMLIFRAGRYRRVLTRGALALGAVLLAAAIVAYANGHRRYQLIVNVPAPFVAEGVQIYSGCCRIVAQLAGDRRTFVFVLQAGDYGVSGMLAQNGEYRPLPTQQIPVHLDHDQAITLGRGG
jgi:hypothetical protein